MSMVTVILPNFQNYTVELPREQLLQMFPQSLFAQAAEYPGPMEITNSLITPEILQAVKTMLTERRIPHLNTDTTAAANYLQIDPLILASEFKLPLFDIVYPDINLLETKSLVEAADDILTFITWNSAPKILWYFLRSLPADAKQMELNRALLQAPGAVDSETVRLLLIRVNPGDMPYIAGLPINPLERTIQTNRVDNVKVLLADARTNFVFSSDPQSSFERLQYLLPRQAFEMINLIIQDYRFDIQAAALDLPHRLDRPDYVRLLLRRPDINVDNSEVVAKIAERLTMGRPHIYGLIQPDDPKVTQSVHLLFYADRTNPNTFLRSVFDIPREISPIILEDWLNEPRLDLTSLNDGFLLSLIYLTPPNMLAGLIPRLPESTRIRLYQLATRPDLFPEPKYSPRDIMELLQPLINPETVPPEEAALEPDLNQYLLDRAGEIYDINRADALMD
jgi:hypothetical protein